MKYKYIKHFLVVVSFLVVTVFFIFSMDLKQKNLFIVLNISLNLLYFLLLPALYAQLENQQLGIGHLFTRLRGGLCLLPSTSFVPPSSPSSNANSLVSAGRSTAVWRARSLCLAHSSFWVLPAF